MRIAAFNVENLFDRAKVFNDADPEAHQDVLDAHAELNTLFELETYQDQHKARMMQLLDQLGMVKRDEGPFTRIRKIRGQLISRPRAPKVPFIKANGRDDWVGWCELRTEAVDELAMEHTARMIGDVRADGLGKPAELVEQLLCQRFNVTAWLGQKQKQFQQFIIRQG